MKPPQAQEQSTPWKPMAKARQELAQAQEKTHQQNRIPIREIRIFESKMPLPAEDFDGATLEVNENQRRF